MRVWDVRPGLLIAAGGFLTLRYTIIPRFR